MACESTYTLGPFSQTLFSDTPPPQGVGVNCLEAVVALYNAYVVDGTYSCADMAGIMEASLPVGFVPAGTLMQPPVIGDFDIPLGSVGDWYLNVTNANSSIGYIQITSDGVNPATLQNFSAWNVPIALTASGDYVALGLGRMPETTLPLGQFTYNFTGVAAFNTAQDFVNCAFPACSITPPPSDPVAYNPSRGLRCSNFSKVINPFGFQRK